MTIELVKILEAAKQYKKESDYWFDVYDKSNDHLDWELSKEYYCKAKTMLDAYEILTGKNIYICEIEEELSLC